MPFNLDHVVSVGIGFLGAGGVGAYIGHKLTLNREKRDRRNKFRGFLEIWLNGIESERDLWKCYGPDNRQELSRYSGELANDFFLGKKKFRRMCEDLRRFKKEEIEADQDRHRKIIASEIKKLIAFV